MGCCIGSEKASQYVENEWYIKALSRAQQGYDHCKYSKQYCQSHGADYNESRFLAQHYGLMTNILTAYDDDITDLYWSRRYPLNVKNIDLAIRNALRDATRKVHQHILAQLTNSFSGIPYSFTLDKDYPLKVVEAVCRFKFGPCDVSKFRAKYYLHMRSQDKYRRGDVVYIE